jgi:hypothetical protein
MTRLVKLLCIGWAVPVTAGVLISCSDGGEPGANAASQLDASNELDAQADARADVDDAGVTDAGLEKCSASKICIADLPLPRKASLSSVRGSSRTDVWAVGNQGLIAHYDGARWEVTQPEAPEGELTYTARGVWLERPDDVWIIEGDRIRHGTGWKGPTATEWSIFRYPIYYGYVSYLPSVVHGLGNTIWIGHLTHAESRRVERFEGWVNGSPGAPESMYAPPGEVHAIASVRKDEVWFAGECYRGDRSRGCAYRAAPPSTNLDAGLADWELTEFDARTSQPLLGAWAHDDVVWLIGEGGITRRVTASTLATKQFEYVPSPVTTDLYAIFGFGPNDIWAVGEASTVIHWDGTSWSKLSTPFDESKDKPRLLSVWGSSPGDVWIAGDGTMLHFQENAQ